MKFTIQRDALSDALSKVQSIVGSRPSIPILSNVKVLAEKGLLTLTTTELEISISATVEAQVSREGLITLPARRVASIIRELPAGEVEVELDDKNCAHIRSGPAYFKMIGMSAEDFPPLPSFEAARSYVIDQGVFKEMLRKVAYAASVDETRYILNGSLLSFADEKLTVVATDGRRLALAEAEVEFAAETASELVVPTKTINELLRFLADEGPLKIRAADNQASFEFGRVLVFSKLLEGKFPNYRQVIPSRAEHRIAIERELLLSAVRRAALVTSEQSSSIRLAFTKNRIEVITSTPDIGESREKIPVKYQGDDFSIAFNPGFIIEPLKVLTQDEVFLEMTDELSPGVIKCDQPFLYVIMPLRTA